MNCIPDWRIRMHKCGSTVLAGRFQWLLILTLSWFSACGAPASDSSLRDDESKYEIEYLVRPNPEAGLVEVDGHWRVPWAYQVAWARDTPGVLDYPTDRYLGKDAVENAVYFVGYQLRVAGLAVEVEWHAGGWRFVP